MSIVVKAGAGLVTGVVAGALGLVLLPRLDPNAVQPRSAVEKPQFVVASAPAPQPAATLAVATDVPVARPTPSPVAVAPAEKVVLRPGVTPSSSASPPPSPSPSPPPKPDIASKAETTVAALPSIAAAPAASPAPLMAPVVAPIAPSSAAADVPPPLRAAPDDAAHWSVLGLVALAKGDLSTARLFLSRAAEAGDARAWVALADTYDPAMLVKLGVVFAPGDAQRARDCLVKAMAAGVVVPKERLAALDTAAH